MLSTYRKYKVDSLGRITIPIGIRRDLGLTEGEYVSVSVNGDVLEIRNARDYKLNNKINQLLDKAEKSNKFSKDELSTLNEMMDRLKG